MPRIPDLTAKEINILLQALRIIAEGEEIYEYAKKHDLDSIREKLYKVKD